MVRKNQTTKNRTTKDRRTITISRKAKKILDDCGHKNENYSDLILRMVSNCGCSKPKTNEKVKKDNQKHD